MDPNDDLELQRLRAGHAELSAFASRLAHDMGAPLRTVHGFAEVLKLTARDQLSGDALGHLDKLTAAVTRVNAMIQSLGRYANIGPVEPPEEPTDLNAIAAEAWELLEADVESVGARLDLEELPCVPVAEAPLRSVFLNLFDNALRFAGGDRPPHVIVSAASDHGEVRITVADDGPGIGPSLVEWACAPLCAGERQPQGAGMGLALVRAHVEAHGGTMGIETGGNGGASVWFTLSRKRPA